MFQVSTRQRQPIQKLIANYWCIFCITNTEISFPFGEEEVGAGNFLWDLGWNPIMPRRS